MLVVITVIIPDEIQVVIVTQVEISIVTDTLLQPLYYSCFVTATLL